MTIYETIKAAVPVRQAAEHYGLRVNRNGMACCPFHNDRPGKFTVWNASNNLHPHSEIQILPAITTYCRQIEV